jgi:uncharacterized protein YndB with AHSA1/START domain
MSEPAPTQLEHQIEISHPLEEVFAFIADARNDPRWCPRVISCEQRDGDGPGLGARYEALEKPTLRPRQTRWIEVVDFAPPNRVVWRQKDEIGDFTITYLLEPAARGTRLTQRDEVAWQMPRVYVPIARRIVARHIRDQLSSLKRLLEAHSG